MRDYSRDGTLATLEASLRRLDTDRIDIALIHDPDDYETRGTGPATLLTHQSGTAMIWSGEG